MGECVHVRLADAGLALMGLFSIPYSVRAFTPLVGQMVVESETHLGSGEIPKRYFFYSRPMSGVVYALVRQRCNALSILTSW